MITIEKILKTTGKQISNKITSGLYGNTIETERGYLIGDPCYFLNREDYKELIERASIQEPEAYQGINREWVSISFKGYKGWFKTIGDGCYSLSADLDPVNVDSGWIVILKGNL